MPLQRFARAIRQLFRHQTTKRPSAPQARPQVQALEERWVPTSTVTGFAFLDLNRNGIRNAGEALLPGINITLRGTTTDGLAASVTTKTNAIGQFTISRVHAGNYQVIASNINYLGTTVGGVSIVNVPPLVDGQTANVLATFRGLAPTAISLRRFLASSATGAAAISPAGTGVGTANFKPFVSTPIGTILVNTSTTTRTIDLANNFNDADFINSRVRMDTNQGSVFLTLEDRLAPLTVANWLGYVTRNDYDNIIFHRLGAFLHSGSMTRDVLQAGQFKFSLNGSNQGQLTRITTASTPTVLDEVNLPNIAGTIAMAKTGQPNSATSEFFFNLIDNKDALSAPPQTNGGFTVFGHFDAASQPVVTALSATNVQNKSTFDGALTDLPLRAGAGTTFPTDTVATDYAIINDIAVLKRNDEGLSFRILSNSRPQLLTPSIINHHLTLNFVGTQTGTTTITVRATDRFGGSVDTSFTVSRS